MPHNTRRRHEIEPASKVAQMVAGATADQRVGYSAEEFLEPASPLTIAKSIAAPISHALRRNVGPTVDGSITTMSPSSSGVKSSEPISLLRDYLLGRKASPPLPLPSVALSSSLAMLPPTRAGFPRVNSLAVRQDARYLTLWLLRLVAPETIGGVRRAEELIVDEVTDCAYLRSDIALLLEVNSCHVQTQIGLARQFWGRAGDGNQKAESLGDFNFEYVDGPDPPEAVQALLRCAFKYDGEPHDGLGGYGGGEPGGPRVQELLDSAHPRNAAVRHGVGTVFTHRQEGYRAVAFGWDNVRKSVDDEIPTDRKPPGGRQQPFYYAYAEDGSLTYVAQSNIVAARVSAGSTEEEAAALLGEYLQLFKLRKMGTCFQTIEVTPWAKDKDKAETGGGKKGGDGGQENEGGEIRMVMNPWMRQAWPFG